MDQIIHFMMQHSYLVISAIVLIVLLIVVEFEAVWLGIRRVSPSELSLLTNRHAVLVDVNTKDEFIQGHILGSIHLPFSEWSKSIHDLMQHKSATVVVVANQEPIALKAAKMLNQQGFTNVMVLGRGLMAWREANLPLVRK